MGALRPMTIAALLDDAEAMKSLAKATGVSGKGPR